MTYNVFGGMLNLTHRHPSLWRLCNAIVLVIISVNVVVVVINECSVV